MRYTITIPASHGLDAVTWCKIGTATKAKPLEDVELSDRQADSLRAKGYEVEPYPKQKTARAVKADAATTPEEV
jgi:hypothetical protein